jgi:hypothetical protein
MRMRTRPIIVFIGALMLLAGCDEVPVKVVTGIERLGFVISATPLYMEPSSLWVDIQCTDFSDPLPAVSANGGMLAPELTPWGVVWRMGWRPPGEQLAYRIYWRGDTLANTLHLPHTVDSVFCNGHYVPKWHDDTLEIEDSFDLTWQSVEAPYYRVHVSHKLPGSYLYSDDKLDTILESESLSIPVQRDSSEIVKLSVSVRTWYGALDGDTLVEPAIVGEHIVCAHSAKLGTSYGVEIVRSGAF